MAISTVNRLITLFDDAFKGLSRPISIAESERFAVLVHQSMNSKRRVYHRVEHVFPMCVDMQPIQVLAALFHDVVYFQLDGGFPPGTQHLLQDVASEHLGDLTLHAGLPEDTAFQVCVALFNFQAGQTLPPYGGTNEFLSAVVAARLLAPHLDLESLIAIVACIEATIPFRAPSALGETAADILAKRVAQQHQLWLAPADASATPAFVGTALRAAVALGNRDVSGFAKSDPGVFLSSTWLLIDESNAQLANPGVYSVQEYRGALVRMASFLAGLDATTIFQCYQDSPGREDIANLAATARRNIDFACEFLDAKITSIAIIEALVLCTGRDCPISMFLGDIRCEGGRPDRVEDFLPEIPLTQLVNDELLNVFEKGRPLESNNDLTASPLTAFIYRCLGHIGAQKAFVQAQQMFAGALEPQAFLQGLRMDMVLGILQACAQIAFSRRAALLDLAASLEQSGVANEEPQPL
ncbi:MAG: hypothetical protein CFE43_10385 [Burkholderiales bacterium PBB3]|nr:MAG: hypothetical protein CFE43_10385 [Burkholderiales bacterium PBB3]